MSKKLVVLVTAFAFVFSLALLNGVSDASNTGPEDMVLKTGNAKKPAKFPHKKHQDAFKCADCHHGEADGKQTPYTDGMEIQQCVTCHNKDMGNKKLNSFKKAAHSRCKGCHKEMKKGPTKCKGCHTK